MELCPRALEVLRHHLALCAEFVAAGIIRHQHLFFLEDGTPDQRPRNHPLALEPEYHRARYSPARALSRAAFLGDLAAHARKESAVGRETARTQRRSHVGDVRGVA